LNESNEFRVSSDVILLYEIDFRSDHSNDLLIEFARPIPTLQGSESGRILHKVGKGEVAFEKKPENSDG
jgi:hypothetical protein